MSTNTTSASAAGSKSTQTFITALILNSAIAGAEILGWLLIRRYFPRIFQPRAILPPEGKRTKSLPQGIISVIPAILLADDEDTISYVEPILVDPLPNKLTSSQQNPT